MSARLEFVTAGTQPSDAARPRRVLSAVFSLSILVFVLTAMVWAYGPAHDAWNILELLAALGRLLAASWPWWKWALFCLAGIGTVVSVWWLSDCLPLRRLVLDARGIQYIPAPLGPLAFLDPAWQLTWHEIESVEQANPAPRHSHPGWRALVRLRTRTDHRVLVPFEWEVKGEPRQVEPFRFTLRAAPRPDWQARLDAHPLVRALVAHGRAPKPYDPAALPWYQRQLQIGQTAFDLESSPRALALIVLFFAGVIAVFLQAFHLPYRYLDAPPWFLLGSIVLLAWPLFMHLLRRRAVPRVECGVVGALGALGCAGLAAAAAPYLNALTDPDAPRRVVMTMHADGHFDAAGVPRFAPPGFIMYWSHVAPGEGYPFELQRGVLGFWQYDARPLEAEFDAFLALDGGRSAAARDHVRRLVVQRPVLP